jgi:uncharacterized protein (DUF362 family)
MVLDRVSDANAALTSGAIIRAVADLVLEALDGHGRVVIADVPLQSADFARVVALTGLDRVMASYRQAGLAVELRDLRQEWLVVEEGIHRGIRRLPGDPLGYAVVNLGRDSQLEAIAAQRSHFAVGDYDRETTRRHHMSSVKNEYLIPKTVLEADVVINLPKLKTHKKSGITCALKNLVGTCGHKSYLPHFREGSPARGGDEFAIDHPIKTMQRRAIDRLQRTHPIVYRVARALGRVILAATTAGYPRDLRTVMSGSWFGNDTLWRTILDLNKIVLYADKQGALRETHQRRYLAIVDGIYSGEGDGPLNPSIRHDGILLAGSNPVLVDLIVCLLMGIDPEAIKQVSGAFSPQTHPLVTGALRERVTGTANFVRSNLDVLPNFHYELAPGWEGHVRRVDGEYPTQNRLVESRN